MPIKPIIKKPRAFISPLLSKKTVEEESFLSFKKTITEYIDRVKREYASKQSEPNIVTNALKPLFEELGYRSGAYSQDGLSGADLILKNSDEKPGVIIEAKKEGSREFINADSLNKRALHEAILYFLRERDSGNSSLFHIIITDFYQFYVFDAKDFDRLFWKNKQIKKLYTNYKDPSILGDGTSSFYEGVERELEKTKADLIDDLQIECAYFSLKEYDSFSQKRLLALYKLLSSDTLLKEFNPNDANSLNRQFYSELLHILGLEEVKESGKKRIKRSKLKEEGSFYENILDKLITYDKLSADTGEEVELDRVLSLLVIWLNRILFLKLVESQVILWSGKEAQKFLNYKKIDGFDELENLFFKVLAKKPKDRPESLKEKFADVPYLNSSLFTITPTERELLHISNLDPHKKLTYHPKTVLKDRDGKKKSGESDPLFYLFEFLDAYDFSSEGSEELQSESKTLINAAVLGLIFEKLNGYKDGSFYTPSFITMYMSKQSVERAIIEKFNANKGWSAKTIDDIYNSIDNKKEANEIVNSLSICDPAVGSGHFLVSVLNHLIYIKHKLGILQDSDGKRLRDIEIELDSDELIIRDEDGELFEYRKGSKEKTRIQKTLFEEKKKLIENSLFGVDINPNSVNICRLRLWIELLKNAYYHEDGNLETLPNIDINIKCGNSLISRYSLTDDIKTKNIKQTINEYKERIRDYKENTGDKQAIQGAIDRLKEQFKLTLKAGYRHRQTLKEKLKSYVSEYGFEGLSKNLTLEAVEFGYLPQAKLIDDDSKQKEKLRATLKKEIELLEAKITEFESGKVYDNAFEWRFEFPEVLDEEGEFRGFDIIIGNPPYIRVQDLKSAHPKECDFYESSFVSAVKNYDIYVLFLERFYTLLSPKGTLSFILPHKFLISEFGSGIRGFLAKNKAVETLLHFGSDMVFEDASTYTCIITLSHSNTSLSYKSTHPKEIGVIDRLDSINYESLSSDKWHLGDNKTTALLQKLNEQPLRVKDVFAKIFQGIATSGDKVYLLEKRDSAYYSKALDRVVDIEDGLLKPLLKGEDISRYKHFVNRYFVIFPYIIDEGKATPMSEEYIKENFPKGYEYLKANEEFLRGREKGKMDKEGWFLYIYPKSLADFEQPKIITPEISFRANMSYDDGVFYHNTKCYSFIKDRDIQEDYRFYLAILNSSLMWFFIKNTGYELRGGYFVFKTKFLEPFPLPKLSNLDEQIPFIDLVDKIMQAKKTNPQADTTELEKKIDEMVYDLYDLSEEEIRIIERK